MHRFASPLPAPPLSGAVSRRSLARRVARLFRPYRALISLIVVSILVTAGLGVANPVLIKVIFDHALFPCGAACPPNPTLLWELVGFMVLIPTVSGAIGIGQTYLTNRVGQRVMQDLREALYLHLQGMSLRFFTGTRTGDIQSRLTNDVGGIQTVVTDTASTILSNVVILLSTLIAMVILSWQLTVLSLAMVPVFLVLTYRAGRARRVIAARAQESKAEISAITQETLSVSGILLTKVFGRQREEAARFSRENRRLADLAIHQEMIGRVLFAVVQIFFSSAPALVYLVAGFVILKSGPSGITPGTIVAFTTLQSRLFFPIGQMLQVSVEVQASLALFERIFDYLELPHDIVTPPGAPHLSTADVSGEVVLDSVRFRYPTSEGAENPDWALDGVTLEVKPGQLAAIVGPSGAGKTTISYLVPRLYDVTEGGVLIDGHDVRSVSLESLSNVIGMVTQETYLFHDTIRRNLMYGRPDATDDEMVAAARAAFIHDRIMELPAGYDTVVGERGYRMSGGEKQRLAIARVALKAPRILILDEATSALDTRSERLVQAALRPLMATRTTIAIAHRLSTILAADVIFVLDRGRVVEQGSHSDLLALDGLYARLYHQQFHDGQVEAECADGLILSSGQVVEADSDGNSAFSSARPPS